MYVETTDYPGQLFHRLVEEHHEILEAVDAALTVEEHGPPGPRVEAIARVARSVRLHARTEEIVIFPVLEGSYELDRHVHEDWKEHATIDAQLRMLERRVASGGPWHHQLGALRTMLQRHFTEEEEIVFPLVRFVINPRSNDLLEQYERERAFLAAQPR